MLTKEEFYRKYFNNNDEKFPYMLLYRMMCDCNYCLYNENVNRNWKHLWATNNPREQIAYMKYIWEYLPEKPEWLTMEKIEQYEKEMCA